MKRFGNNGNNNNKEETLLELVEVLVKHYISTESSITVSQKMVESIEKFGGIVLGIGQNRIGFTMDNHETVFKVAYREIGMRDNMMERFNYNLVSSSDAVYKELGPYCPEVTRFALQGDLESFMLQMEFVEDLATNKQFPSLEETAVYAVLENSENAAACIEAWSKYFHILDAHPTASALNFGNKDGNVAFRDFGYCIPKIDDFEQITNNVNGNAVIYEYVNLFRGLHGTTEQKILTVQSQMEAYAPYDGDGKLIVDREEEASEFVQALMKSFVSQYL